ncbi:MAG: Rieske 2Fe-2S domain-containing protein [Thermoplasmata archaeon]|jgi:Rieske Fe-S protein|nr:Rieske 2Fe-2S domain-containing protein [Thermoplasmata archaeon]
MFERPGCSTDCPYLPPRSGALDFPIGQVRRLAAAREAGDDVDETRRNVLKLAGVGALVLAGGGLGAASIQYVQPPTIGLSSYPKTQLVDVDGKPLTVKSVETEYDVTANSLYLFNYPLRNEPNFFLNLAPANGQAPSDSNPGAWNVPGGVGTHGSIVAFSAICQHLGCPAPAIAYYPPGQCPGKTFNTPNSSVQPFYIHCSCHGSTYDPANAASNLTGPAVLPLPQVTLVTDVNGNIFATSLTGPPVNGHLNSLQGDYGVGGTSQLVKETPVILCQFPS